MIDDLELMVGAAVGDSRNGHNIYLEARTVREDLSGGDAVRSRTPAPCGAS